MSSVGSSVLFIHGHSNPGLVPTNLEALRTGTLCTELIDVQEGCSTYESTWQNPDGSELTLDATQLYSLFDSIAPKSGVESKRGVIRNLQGVHELRDEKNPGGRAVLNAHRAAFGDDWRKMAMSRRLIQTVLQGGVEQIDYDASLSIRPSEARPVESILNDKRLLVLAAFSKVDAFARKRQLFDTFTDETIASMPTFMQFGAYARSAMQEDDPYFHWHEYDDFLYDQYRKTISDEQIEKIYHEASSRLDADKLYEGFLGFIDETYETFTDKDGVRHAIPRHWRSEEGISAQAHYHQRRLISGYSFQFDTSELCMQYPKADEPWEFGIEGTNPRASAHSGRHNSFPGSRVKPVLRWRSGEATRDGNGGREIVTNDQLPPSYTREEVGSLTYGDTLTALAVLALAHPEVTASWDVVGRFKGRERSIPLGAAQVPLLTLLSADVLLNTSNAIPYLESKAS